MSLGFVGLFAWLLLSRHDPLRLPRLRAYQPMFWILLFALYAFVVSASSGETIAIAYAVQFVTYVSLGSILFTRHIRACGPHGLRRTTHILISVGLVYSVGMLISLKTGPIYVHQTTWTARPWGGYYIQQAVGFSEGQNLAGLVIAFFIGACIYLYRAKRLARCRVLLLFVFALLGTLSRSAILSTLLGVLIWFCIANSESIMRRFSLRVATIKEVRSVSWIFLVAIGACLYVAYSISPKLPRSLLPAFGFTDEGTLFLSHLSHRLHNWAWGMDYWRSNPPLKMLFGTGFRSSMTLTSIGSWFTAHNAYITILGEFGLIGISLFLCSILAGLVHFGRLVMAGRAERTDHFAIFGLVVLSIHNMTGTYFYSPVCLTLLLFIFALAETAPKRQHERSHSSDARLS